VRGDSEHLGRRVDAVGRRHGRPLGHFLPSQLLTRVQEIVAPSAHGTVEG
jgi:hypothetical protein